RPRRGDAAEGQVGGDALPRRDRGAHRREARRDRAQARGTAAARALLEAGRVALDAAVRRADVGRVARVRHPAAPLRRRLRARPGVRDFLDFLARWVEPYVSFRWMVAMIFGAMLVSDLLGTWLWLRDVSKAAPDATPREQRLRRIARAAIGSQLLRLFSWDSLL